MRFASTLMALAATFLLVGATPVDELAADSTACYTTHTGYFEGFEPFGLSADHHVVWPPGKNGAKFKVHFQRCPKLTRYGEAHSFAYWGRLLASETSTIGANQCVTSTASSTDGIIYLKLATCGNAYVPPASQSWEYMDDDFGKLMWFVSIPQPYPSTFSATDAEPYFLQAGQCKGDQSGWLSDPSSSKGDPLTTKGTHLVKISCINTSGESSFTLSGLNP